MHNDLRYGDSMPSSTEPSASDDRLGQHLPRADSRSDAVADWDWRSAGREVALWRLHIESRAAAVDRQEARVRLTQVQRRPWPYLPDVLVVPEVLTHEVGKADLVAEVPSGQLSVQHREQLITDYPGAAWQLRHGPLYPRSARTGAHVEDYLRALDFAYYAAAGEPLPAAEQHLLAGREIAPAQAQLRFWRSVWRVEMLCGSTEEAARERAALLAATVVDHRGHGAGLVVGVERVVVPARTGCGEIHPAHHLDGLFASMLWGEHDIWSSVAPARAVSEAVRSGGRRARTAWMAAGAQS